MRKIVFGVLITLVVVFTFKYFNQRKKDAIVLKESSALIQEQIKNVSKLVVTEGSFSEIYNYKNSKEVFGDYLTADKTSISCC